MPQKQTYMFNDAVVLVVSDFIQCRGLLIESHCNFTVSACLIVKKKWHKKHLKTLFLIIINTIQTTRYMIILSVCGAEENLLQVTL